MSRVDSMPADSNPSVNSGPSVMSEPLSERERRRSQRAFIAMAILLTLSAKLLEPSGILGMYFKQLGISSKELGGLMAWAAPFGIASLLLAGLANKVGKKRMLAWAIVPAGLLIMALLLLRPIKDYWGLGVMLVVAWGLLAGRRVLDSLLNIPWFPLIKDITQANRRGAFLGRMRMFWGSIAVVSMILTARVLGKQAPMGTLMILLALGGIIYWLILWPLYHITERRTEPLPQAVSWIEAWGELRRNRLFVRCVLVETLFWIAMNMFMIFQYFFLTEGLGWSDSFAFDLVWVNVLGLAVTSVFWGAAADRLGDRAVAQLGFLGLTASTCCWIAAANNEQGAGVLLIAGALGLGIFRAACQMSLTRVVLNGIPERLAPSLFAVRKIGVIFAVMCSGWLGSFVLYRLEGWYWPGQNMLFWLDGYKVLFLVAMGALLAAVWLCRKFPTVPGRTPWTVLATMFNRPIQTIWMVSQIDSSLPEDGRLDLVRRLSQSPSRLANESLVQGLRDASYDVRLASVNALASRSDPSACEALMAVLNEGELDIQPEAAWALGELGDRRAIAVLMDVLAAESELLRGRTARALGKLGAEEAVPGLKRMLAEDSDSFVRRSAAIALSRLKVREALGPIFEGFRSAPTRLAQRELALALANLVHGGDLYYRIRKQGTEDMDAVLGEIVDEVLVEKSASRKVRRCFSQMVEVLREGDSTAVRTLAGKALSEGLIHRPIGSAGELAKYLMASNRVEPWTEEHGALLIFLLLQEWRNRKA